MSARENEIPGFYRDPRTGKYYREKPGDVGNSSLKKLKLDRSMDCIVKNPVPKIANVTMYLRERQLGEIGGIGSETQYLKMKTHKKKLIRDISLNRVQPHDILLVDFITGCDKSVFGKWGIMGEDHPNYIVGEQNYVNTQNHTTAEFRKCRNIVDMCRGPAETLICLYNNPFLETGFIDFLEKRQITPSAFFTNDDLADGFPFFSCCEMRTGYTFAVGGFESILLFDAFDLNYMLPVKGKVHTLSFHEASNALVSGAHNGRLYVSDIRTRKQEASIKISSKALIDSVFVDQNQVIVADAEKTLVMVDFRNKKIITTFNGHTHTVKKRHFSFVNNLLCGTGKDNVIRIWSLSGGEPIHEIKPLISVENNIRGWLNGDANKTYLNYFEAEYHKIYEV